MKFTTASETRRWAVSSVSAACALMLALTGCGDDGSGPGDENGNEDGDSAEGERLTIYSGRDEGNVGPLFEQFEEDSGIQLDVRYGDSAELTAQILEEGEATPADVYFTLEVGGINALASDGQITTLSDEVLEQVSEAYVVDDGTWVATAARARVLAYNPDNVDVEDLPETIDELTGEEWQERVGFAPTNSSFQAFISGFRAVDGDDRVAQWLSDFAANDPESFDNNRAIIEGVENGTVDVGLVNHYYYYKMVEENGEENVHFLPHYITGGDPLGIPVVGGIAVLESSEMQEEGNELISFLLSEEAQQHFADDTAEYPVRPGVESTEHDLPPLEELGPPPMDLAEVASMEETLALLQDAGLL